MADIELVIKIPEEIRLALINNIQLSPDQQSICDSYIKQAVINGTILPKGCGMIREEKVMSDKMSNYEDVAKAFQLGLAFGFGEKHDEMDKVIEEIKKVITPQPKMEVNCDWIPVSERLPEENKTVIVSTKYGVYPEAKYTKEYGWEWAYEAGADYWKELEDVTAWMPLPERYKEESEE